ncbi:hypothetical protein [Streptomyces sp. NPDC050982]|uniref:hypothetical protein n=1 Tax=Streptomyces sp. NPDC050982 TaxID=3154746 RepID=UPI0033CB20E2
MLPDVGRGVPVGSPSTTLAPAPDVRMYFFGAISGSQVAINSGTVTQTMVKEYTETYLGGAPQALSGPEKGSASRESRPPHRPMGQPPSATTAGGARSISAETFCRRYLPPMLDDLQRRVPELGLSREAEKSLEQKIVDLRDKLNHTPLDMEAVAVGLDRIEEALMAAPRNVAPLPRELRGAPTRGGAL